ncbi:hypothetical protein A2U01_0066151, partial [Trifolium medium]|nr:hypothetical protein [Trifolium medium]
MAPLVYIHLSFAVLEAFPKAQEPRLPSFGFR